MKPRAHVFFSHVGANVQVSSCLRRRRIFTPISNDQSMTCSIFAIFPGAFGKQLITIITSRACAFLPSRKYSRVSRRWWAISTWTRTPSDRPPKFQKTSLSFDIAFVLSKNLPTSRIFRGTSDRQTDRIRTASKQPKSTLASGCTSRRRWTSWVLGLWKRGRSGARIAPGLFSSFFPPPRPLSLRISSTFFTDTPLHPPFAPSSRAQCYMCSLRCPVSHSPRTLFISLTLVLLPPCIQRSTPVLLSLLSARIRGWRRDFNASRAYMSACACA